MIKCFLSHSSSDKESYVHIVARKLRKEVTVLDEETFEAGMGAAEEIAYGLNESTLFVIFLSDAALNSRWVQSELRDAVTRFNEAQIQRIYPIIIQSGIKHDDPRIPSWMRDSLNIRPILKPTIAARKINARLLELSWKTHPRLKGRQEIFVGRNELVRQIEERLDDFSIEPPIALIASGLPAIGRKSLLRHAMKKANLVRDSYEFPTITLSSLDNIEDFILKIVDFGIVEMDGVLHSTTTVDQKIEIAKKLVDAIIHERERILIEDYGALVQNKGGMVDWFLRLLSSLSDKSHIVFCIASQFRLNPSISRTCPFVYSVAVNELDSAERNGLLVRYARFESLDLNRDDLSYFSDLLTGYPQQVLFAVDCIRDFGVYKAKKQSHIIKQYGSDMAQVALDAYKDNTIALEFIHFLCRFEFISYEVLFDIADEEDYFPLLNDLLARSIGCRSFFATKNANDPNWLMLGMGSREGPLVVDMSFRTAYLPQERPSHGANISVWQWK